MITTAGQIAAERLDNTIDELTTRGAQIERLQFAVRKLASWNGVEIVDLIEDGYLDEGDMDA